MSPARGRSAIPLARLRESGVLDTLLTLAGIEDGQAGRGGQDDAEERIDALDVESLVQMSLAGETVGAGAQESGS
jgi:hypothetical protein